MTSLPTGCIVCKRKDRLLKMGVTIIGGFGVAFVTYLMLDELLPFLSTMVQISIATCVGLLVPLFMHILCKNHCLRCDDRPPKGK